jgi:hypothetical protein
MTPLISVVIPVFNAERYLDFSIRSMQAQTFADWEMIVIDDGSTDMSGAVAEDCARKDPRIRVFHKMNTGIAEARNAGWQTANGQYIAWQDADDLSYPDRLGRQLEFLLKNPSAAVVGTGYEDMDGEGRSLGKTFRNPGIIHGPDLSDITWSPVAQGTAMVRKEALQRVNGYRKVFTVAEDLDLWLRLAEQYQLANLSEVLVRVRYHSQSASNSRICENALCELAAWASARFRKENGFDPIDGVKALSPDVLAKLGIDEETALMGTAQAFRGRASIMLLKGDIGTAERLIDQYKTARIPAKIRRQLAPEFEFLRARIAFARAQKFQSMRFVGRIGLHQPTFLVSLAAKALRQWQRRPGSER